MAGAAKEKARVAPKRTGWKARGSAPLNWEKGMEIEATYVRLQPKVGDTGAIVTLDVIEPGSGEISRCRYWAPTILAMRLLDDFKEGEEVLIVCLGKNVPSKRGQDAWGFDVYGR